MADETVNLVPSGSSGSNPSPRTMTRLKKQLDVLVTIINHYFFCCTYEERMESEEYAEISTIADKIAKKISKKLAIDKYSKRV